MGASKNEQVDTSASDPRLLLSSFKPMLLNSDILCGDLDMIWNVDYFDDRATEADSPQRSSADSDSNSDRLNDSMEVNTFSDPVLPSWNEETRNLSFDMVSRNSLSKFGPSPSLVLEGLTLTKSNDGFDMERLETIGDSILKLVIGIYVYGQTASKHLDEGRLSQMRMQQINNKYLFRLGQHKNLGRLISGQSFDLSQNFLPPGFRTPEQVGGSNLHVQQYISTKNIADSMGISFLQPIYQHLI